MILWGVSQGLEGDVPKNLQVPNPARVLVS